jgi:sulfopyruvate decarboxylase alpha subunit
MSDRPEWVNRALDGFRRLDVDLVAHLPDSTVGPLVDAVEATSDVETVLVTREEEAVGVLAGAWLGGRRGVLCCQSSGLATAFNAIASLSLPARLPFLAVVTRRGDLGEFNVAQVPGGYGMPGMLDALGVRNRCVDDVDEVAEHVVMAGETAYATELPYVLLFESPVTGYKSEDNQ